jgi:hypothetical protein
MHVQSFPRVPAAPSRRSNSSVPQHETPSVLFAGKQLSTDEARLASLKQELSRLDQKMERYERRAEKAGDAMGVVGAGATVIGSMGAGIAADAALTAATAGANLLVSPAVATAGSAAMGAKAADEVGGFFKKTTGRFVRGWGKFFNEDEHNAARHAVNQLSSSVNAARSTLNTLDDLERVAQKAKYASEISTEHKSAFHLARLSDYTDLTDKHSALKSIVSKVPGLGLDGGTDTAFNAAKQDLRSTDARVKSLALRRFYQAEKEKRNRLEESPAIYKTNLMDHQERVAAASLRAMVEESQLRPGHYNQVLSSALASGKPKLQKAALLGLKAQLQPTNGSSPYLFRSVLIDGVLENLSKGKGANHKIKTLAAEVLQLRKNAGLNPEKTIEEAAELVVRPFAGNPMLKGDVKTYLTLFQQAINDQTKSGSNLLLYAQGEAGIGKTQFTQSLAKNGLGEGSLLEINAGSLESRKDLENRLKEAATGFRDGKYRFDGRTIFLDEFHQVGTNSARGQIIPMLKSMIGKEQLPQFDFKNSILSMAGNDDIHNSRLVPGFHESGEAKSLLSRMQFARDVDLSVDIKGDINGFVYRYVNAQSYMKDFPNLKGMQLFPAATRYFQERLKQRYPEGGSRILSPRDGIAYISKAVEDAMAITPGFHSAHQPGQPFIIDYDQRDGLKAVLPKR